MNDFRESMEISELHDQGYKGDLFTWKNHHTSETFTKERLGRVLTNTCWSQLYTWVEVKNMVARYFDHKPILVTCKGQFAKRDAKRRIFRYEASRDLEKECSVNVKQF